MSFWTDTHAHVYLEDFNKDREDMLARSHAADVQKVYMPNIDQTTIDSLLEVERRFPGVCVPMMGLHPCSVKKDFGRELYLVEQWLATRDFAAIGEIGTDLYWDKTFWEHQKDVFQLQVGWAKKYKLPVVIHCRESLEETIELLRPLADKDLTGIFHCFSGTLDQARKIIDMNFYLGVGGVVTFKNAGLDKVIPDIDPEKIVLETDCPYLAPAPYRGKRNEPAYLPLIAQKICDLKKITAEKLQTITAQNVNKIFKPVVAS